MWRRRAACGYPVVATGLLRLGVWPLLGAVRLVCAVDRCVGWECMCKEGDEDDDVRRKNGSESWGNSLFLYTLLPVFEKAADCRFGRFFLTSKRTA